jgi:hypothetical protein
MLSIWNKLLASIKLEALTPANEAKDDKSPIEPDEESLSKTKVVLA